LRIRFVAWCEWPRNHEARDLPRRIGADAAENADAAPALGGVVPESRRTDASGVLLEHGCAMHFARDAGVQRDPGDPGIEVGRLLFGDLTRPCAFPAQPGEVGKIGVPVTGN